MDIYWSPYVLGQDYASLQLLYDEPDPVIPFLTEKRNKENKRDNFLSCHAFLNNSKNTFVLRNPVDVDVRFDEKFGKISTNQETARNSMFVIEKEPSLVNSLTFTIYAGWIFWSDKPVVLTSMPAYFHKPVFDGYYVPGSFNINSWFRPLEAAIQLNENVDVLSMKRQDPVAYVKINTDETAKLRRFYMSDELKGLSDACVGYKKYDPSRSLAFLYDKFSKNGLNKAISREIKKNLA
jgi:hypothetical protein